MTPERELELILAAANWLRYTSKHIRGVSAVTALCEKGLTPAQARFAVKYAGDVDSMMRHAANDNGV
ncbi:MAG: hypothetical protein E5V62_19010 [Mesorhizobium sp.]|uniref:hypothetical protein n=1 Tax=Mesorhizobium sp. TaxID=1871066 RepID=UPI000FD5E42D|nr:hypothetical protein [Mesorhizobium sp.]RVD72924.1 hypothetical protein EN751_07515 [Mesorhizobium sp. M4A.F.Ca.ET.029.04.2.1]TIW33761.1 MAG: hypothetical protein E5V62_19010 [Mesorhizobium sp.]